MAETLEMKDLNVDYTKGDEQQDEDYTLEETTNLDDDDWSKKWEKNQATVLTVGDDLNTDLTTSLGPAPRLDPLFGTRYFEYKTTTELFDLLGLEDECNERGFVKWLMDKKAFSVERMMSESRIVTDYKFEYYGYGEGGAKPFRRFETIGRAIDGQEHITTITEIRKYYDQYRSERLNKILKKAGIVTAVGVSLVSLITGLSLGLKRKGHDLVRDSKKEVPWTKLNGSTPSGKTVPWTKLDGKETPSSKTVPWTELEYASGKGLIILGDNIYLVIGGVCVGVYFYRKKKNK